LYSSTLDSGGIELDKEANFDKNFRKGRKIIIDCCFVLKLTQNVVDMATARFLSIIRIILAEKIEREKNEREALRGEAERERLGVGVAESEEGGEEGEEKDEKKNRK
jgi:hypothetical protein